MPNSELIQSQNQDQSAPLAVRQHTERLTPHFSVAELACRCCGACHMDGAWMQRLETLRIDWGQPMVVTSGYRCPTHNQNVSSSGPNGPHPSGRAVDIQVAGPRALALICLALKRGCTGIGVKQHGPWKARFLHLDDMPRPQAIIWSYA